MMKRTAANTVPLWLLKLALTALLMAYLNDVLRQPEQRKILLAEFGVLGDSGTISLIVIFFGAVALYARTLQRCLNLIQPQHRAAPPQSVWNMFLLPINFIEDFFIIRDVSASIQAEKRNNPSLNSLPHTGAALGYGWCILQILCFIPHVVGKIAALLALILWGMHWAFVARVNRQLSQK